MHICENPECPSYSETVYVIGGIYNDTYTGGSIRNLRFEAVVAIRLSVL